jgi:hypothetical protein
VSFRAGVCVATAVRSWLSAIDKAALVGNGGRRPLRQQLSSFVVEMSAPLKALIALVGAIGTVVGTLTAVGVIGGGSGGSAATGGRSRSAVVTVADWARRANAVCARTNETRAALPTPQKGLGMQEIADLIKTASTFQERLLHDLAALPRPPVDQQHQITRLLRVGAELDNATSELVDDLTLGDLAGVQERAGQLSQLNTSFNHTAIALGATDCAEGGSVADVLASK